MHELTNPHKNPLSRHSYWSRFIDRETEVHRGEVAQDNPVSAGIWIWSQPILPESPCSCPTQSHLPAVVPLGLPVDHVLCVPLPLSHCFLSFASTDTQAQDLVSLCPEVLSPGLKDHFYDNEVSACLEQGTCKIFALCLINGIIVLLYKNRTVHFWNCFNTFIRLILKFYLFKIKFIIFLPKNFWPSCSFRALSSSYAQNGSHLSLSFFLSLHIWPAAWSYKFCLYQSFELSFFLPFPLQLEYHSRNIILLTQKPSKAPYYLPN